MSKPLRSSKVSIEKVYHRYNTDVAAKKIWLSLVRDFRRINSDSFAVDIERIFTSGLSNFRDFVFPTLGSSYAPNYYKCWLQLQSLLKKYRFVDDRYSDQELEARTIDKFMEEQLYFSSHTVLPEIGYRVLQKARSIAKRILGAYSPEETIIHGRFGKKSSVGCPLALAYVDWKLSTPAAFTSSSECSKWFLSKVVDSDPLLRDVVTPVLKKLDECNLGHESLHLNLVPKNWKTHRPITPLTLLSLFYSFGYGFQVTEALKREGIDIAKQQHRHRRWIEQYSVDLTHATADLSSASQSLTTWLLNRILPREWYCALKPTLTHQITYTSDGVDGQAYTESVLPMGNGATFPVETLVFYSVLKAIQELSGVKGRVSVFGDDLIYPSGMHKFVKTLFPMFKFVLNSDKTFVESHFRESCGSDFFRGVDVRAAFLPQGGLLNRTKYIQWLYKCYNALTRRWDAEDISSTLYAILLELAQVAERIFRVPPSYPDTAGIKVSSPGVIPLDTKLLPWSPIHVLFTHGSRWYNFCYVADIAPKRAVVAVLPYYWQTLAGQTDLLEADNFWETDYNYLKESVTSALSWERVMRKKVVVLKSGRRKTVVRTSFIPSVPLKQYTRATEVWSLEYPTNDVRWHGSNSDWI